MEWLISNQERWRAVWRYALAWTLLGLVSASQAYIFWSAGAPPPGSRSALFVWQLAFWYSWGAFTPLVLWLGRRLPLERQHWRRNALAHALAGAAVAGLHLVFYVWTWRLLLPERVGRLPFVDVLRQAAQQQFDFEWLVYWAVLGSGYFLEYYRRYRERDLAAAQLQHQLAEAQLRALKMQLHPHFLFNTLNTIATLVRKHDNDAAVQVLAGLGDLLRHTLEQVDKQEVPLKDELDFIERYLAIEQVRFRDRLTVRMQIAPDTLAAAVPSLILQPLVENAVRHGFAQSTKSGLIEISATRAGEMLLLQIRDDGRGLPPDIVEGVGLRNTRARLQQLYGDAHRFLLRNGNGLTVELAIPFRRTASHNEGET